MTQDQEPSTTLPDTQLTDAGASFLAPVTSENATPTPQGLAPTIPELVVSAARIENQKVGPFEPPRCGGVGRDGQPCGQLRVLKTVQGWRCRHHRDGGQAKRRRLPVRALRTLDDAATLAGWAAVEACAGRMAVGEAGSIAQLIREWRQSFGDAHTLGRFNALEKQIAELTRRA